MSHSTPSGDRALLAILIASGLFEVGLVVVLVVVMS